MPDTYDRLNDARALASGDLPTSAFYPPGVPVIMAPVFAILPDSLMTMQVVIVACGVGLVLVSFWWMLAWIGDHLAALFIAGCAATCPAFIYASRDALYDIMVVFLVGVLLALAGRARGASLPWLIAYGLMVAIFVNIRPNNVFLLPAFALVYSASIPGSFKQVLAFGLRDRFLIVSGMTAVTVALVIALSGPWIQNSASAPITADKFVEHIFYYLHAEMFGNYGLLFAVPFAILGIHHLWTRQPLYACAIAYVLVAWPLIHAPFDFASFRYMLPPLFLFFFLVAIGLSISLRVTISGGKTRLLRGYAIVSVVMLAVNFAFGAGTLLHEWPHIRNRSDEGLARTFDTPIAELDEGSLVVSAVARAVNDGSERIEYFDLIDTMVNEGTGPRGVQTMKHAVSQHFAEGHDVYYLFSHWEQGQDFRGDGKDGFAHFWSAINEGWVVEALVKSPERFSGHSWTLYRISERTQDSLQP